MGRTGQDEPVAILMSTFNGDRFLAPQLHSLLSQTHTNWQLHWRDDGSEDRTLDVLAAFQRGPGRGRTQSHDKGPHLGTARSFLKLLRDAIETNAAFFAFADQDDIWLPDKIARAVAALASLPSDRPALYCSGHLAVDEALTPVGMSPAPIRRIGFPASLTQNVAQGCTVMLNRHAARLIASSRAPAATWHDWWSYLVVTASGGTVVVDPAHTLLYRQHRDSQIGIVGNMARRGIAALRRGREPFMSLLRAHANALERQPHLLTEENRRHLDTISRAVDGPFRDRLGALRLAGFHRQTWEETLVFRLWFALG